MSRIVLMASAAFAAAVVCPLAGCGPDPFEQTLVDWDKELRRAERERATSEPPVRPSAALSDRAEEPVTLEGSGAEPETDAAGEPEAEESAERPEPEGEESPGDSEAPERPSDAEREAAGGTKAGQQGPLRLSPERAVVRALHQNRSLAVRQLDPAIAETFAEIERSIYDPEVFAEADIARDRRSETSRATTDRFDVATRSNTQRAGVRQELPTGTDVQLDVGTTREASNRTQEQHESRAGLTLTQALLRGASPAANLVSIRQASLDQTASDYQLRGFTQALVADVLSTYWRYVLAVREIRIFERALEVAEQLAEETRQQIEVGTLPETESAAAEAEVALRRQDLIDARSEMQQIRLELLRLLNPGGEPDWDRTIRVPEETAVPEMPEASVEKHVELAGRFRPDVNEARVRMTQDRLEVVRTRNGLLPRLDLFLTLGKTGFATSFNRSVRNMGQKTHDLSAGLSFEYPLGNRRAEALHRQALLRRQRASKSVANLIQLAELDVRQAYVEARRSREQVDASAATRRLRKRAFEAETEKLRVGKSTNLLVAQAQRDLLASQIAEVEAIINLKLALIDLYRLEGTLLKRRGVEAPGATQHTGL